MVFPSGLEIGDHPLYPFKNFLFIKFIYFCFFNLRIPIFNFQSVMERMNQRRKGLKDAAKNITELFPKLDIFGRENAQHAKSHERNQKRYRNVQSVFTLEDSDDSDNDATFGIDASNTNERV